MHRFPTWVGFLFATLTVSIAGATHYGARIVVPEKLSAPTAAAVDDLRHYLAQMTGREFSRSTDFGSTGITLALSTDARVPAPWREQLHALGPEAFGLWPDGERLWIVASSEAGLAHGAVGYLEQLGVRWYHVTERWTIVPRRASLALTTPVVMSPAFRSRAFAGTGGFGPATPRDPQRQMQTRWNEWLRRNRFGGEFQLSGHTGEAFNTKYRQLLEEHSEYRALVNGKRADWWLAGKFCLSQPHIVQLYVDDRLAAYRQARQSDPHAPRAWAVSVEPADGGGHCECAECLKLGSVSDRVFHLANLVARAVRQEFPDGRVSLFAYNEHAAVPQIELEQNVYVAVIPYGFQRTDLAPEQLIDAWSRKVRALAIYDYWSIPDWSHDAPTFDPLGAGPAKLRSWQRRGVNGFLCESTYSGGAMGLAWWLMSRLTWQPDGDVDAWFGAYCRDCFGAGAPAIERMLRRWSVGYWPTSHELALSFRDVDEAWRLAESDPAAAARIADLGRYVEYLRLLYHYDAQKLRTEARYRAAIELADYGWSIYDSAMVHAYRHAQLLGRDEAPTHAEIRDRYDPRNPAAPGWAASTQLTDAQIRARVAAGVAALEPALFTPRRYSGPLEPVASDTSLAPREPFGPQFYPASSQTIDFYFPSDRRTCTLRLAVEQPVRLTLLDAEGNVLRNEVFRGETGGLQQWRDVRLDVPAGGAYRVQLWSPKRTFGLQLPLDVPHGLAGWINSQGRPTPRLYFYVPKNVERLVIYARYTAAGPPKFFDPAGRESVPEFRDDQRLMLLDIPVEQRGQIWSLEKAKCPIEHLQMLNVPGSFAFSAETVLAPSDALQQSSIRP